MLNAKFMENPLPRAVAVASLGLLITAGATEKAKAEDIVLTDPSGPFIFLSDLSFDYPEGGSVTIAEGASYIAVLHDYFTGINPDVTWTLIVDGTLTGEALKGGSYEQTILRYGGELIVNETGIVNNVNMLDGGTVTNSGTITGVVTDLGGSVALESSRSYDYLLDTGFNPSTDEPPIADLTVTNSGIISALGNHAVFAYDLDNISITNSGDILVTPDTSGGVPSDFGVAALAVGADVSTTIINSGVIDAGIDETQAATAIVALSGAYSSSNEGYIFGGATGSFNIVNEASGAITGELIFSNVLAGQPGSSYELTFQNDGILAATGDSSGAAAITSHGATTFINNGQFNVSGSGSVIDHLASAGNLESEALTLVNDGTIISESIAPMIVTNSANITNTGVILSSASGEDLEPVVLLIDALNEGDTGTTILINNSGVIQAGADIETAEAGVAITTDSISSFDIENSGDIYGQIELSTSDDSLNNSGLIAGNNIDLDAGDDSLVNTGNIDAAINFGEGNNSLDNQDTILSEKISFGEGNDTLSNSGSLSGDLALGEGDNSMSTTGSLVSESLTFGAGLDTLEIAGTFDVANTNLGAGDDQVSIGDDSLIEGEIDGGEGSDSLAFNGSGDSAGVFTNFETTTFNGSWSLTAEGSSLGDITLNDGELSLADNTQFTSLNIATNGVIALSGSAGSILNSGSLSVGEAGVAETLAVEGDFTLEAGGVVQMDAFEDGTADFISVSGSAVLNGGQLVTLSNDSAWAVDQTYTLLSADGGLSGEFDSVTNNLEYLIPTLAYSANDVVLSLARENEAIQGDILETTNSQQLSVITRVVPTIIQGHIGSSVANTLGLTGAVASLMARGSATGLSAGDESQDLRNSAWLNITPSRYDQTGTLPGVDRLTKFDGESINFMFGMDRLVSDSVVLGGFVGYEDARVDLREIDGRQENDGFMVGAYAGVTFTDWFYASANGHWATLSNSLEERAFNPTTPETADYDSDRYGLGVDLNAMTAIGNIALLGQVAYNYTSESYDRYTSSSGQEVALDDTDLGRFSFTAEMSYAGDNWSPYISAAYEIDTTVSDTVLDDDGFLINAGLRFYGSNYSLEAYASTVEGRDNENHYMFGINGSLMF